MFKIAITILSFSLFSVKVCSQIESGMIPLTTRQGLSSNTVYDIVQDKDGFLWIATPDGLNRYDGTEVVKFLHDSTPNSIPSNQVRCLALLPHDIMAIGTSAGLCLYNLKSGVYKQCYFNDGNGLQQYDNLIQSITIDGDGNLWLCAATAILKITPEGKLLKIIRSSYTIHDIGKERFGFVHKIVHLSDRLLLFFLKDGNYVYDIDKNKLENIYNREYERFSFLKNTNHSQVFEAGNNYLLFFKGSVDSVFLYHKIDRRITRTYYPYSHKKAWRQNVSCIDSNHLIIAHQTYGYNWIQLKNASLTVSNLEYENYQFGKSIKDSQGNIWFINYLGGLLKKQPASGRFRFIPLYDKPSGKIIDEPANYIMPLDNLYYISTYGKGLFIYDTVTGRQKQIIFHGASGENDCNYVWQITKHQGDTLWVGTQCGMFWLTKNYHYGRLPNSNGKPAIMDSVAISVQYLDSKGRLWVGLGSGNGVCYYDRTKKTFTYFKGRSDGGYPFRYPLDIVEDKKGKIWFVSDQNKNLLYFDEDKKSFIPVAVFSKGKSPFSFICLFIDAQNIFWIGSNSGMIRFDPNNKSTTIYGREQGLCNNNVEDIAEDTEGNLWINTDGGLSCFDKKKKLFINFYQKDALPSDFLDFRFHIFSDGRIVTGGYGGPAIFDPAKLLRSSHKMIPFVITSCKVNDHYINVTSYQSLELKPSEKNISFRFSGIDLSNGPQNNYLYRLKGSGDYQWISLGRQRQINFSNLSPGHYALGLRCVDEAGNIKSADIEVAFHIKAPFTQTIWFYLCLSALAVGIFYFIYRYRIGQLKKLEKIRSTISRDLHDEIGANLTNISYQSLMGKMNVGDKEKTEESFTHIYDDSRKVSEAMREIIWNINPANDLLENALPRMLQYATELLEARQIKVEASLPTQIEKLELGMEQRRDLYLIFKEAVNNIAKHANASRVKIIFTVLQKELSLQIYDNGTGYDADKEFSGNGIRNMKTRASRHHWDLRLNEEGVTGSSFYLTAHLA